MPKPKMYYVCIQSLDYNKTPMGDRHDPLCERQRVLSKGGHTPRTATSDLVVLVEFISNQLQSTYGYHWIYTYLDFQDHLSYSTNVRSFLS